MKLAKRHLGRMASQVRLPHNEKERVEKGHVVFYKGQEDRYGHPASYDPHSQQAGSVSEGGKEDPTIKYQKYVWFLIIRRL
jgi:hypothetical protein